MFVTTRGWEYFLVKVEHCLFMNSSPENVQGQQIHAGTAFKTKMIFCFHARPNYLFLRLWLLIKHVYFKKKHIPVKNARIILRYPLWKPFVSFCCWAEQETRWWFKKNVLSMSMCRHLYKSYVSCSMTSWPISVSNAFWVGCHVVLRTHA